MVINKRKQFEKDLNTALVENGYKKSSIQSIPFHIYRINDKISKTVSMSYTSYLSVGHLLIDAFIGVSLHQIDEMKYNLLEGYSRYRYKPSETIWVPIYNYIPGGHMHYWDMSDISQSKNIVNDIICKIDKYGGAFFEPFGDGNLETIAEYLINEPKSCGWGNRDYIIPIVFYLLGEKQKGWKYIENRIDVYPKAYCEILDRVYLKNYLALP